jgi:hypothetical protein
VTTSKVRVKLGQLEVECEGTEEFLKDELPKLLDAFLKLQPKVPPAVDRPTAGLPDSAGTAGGTGLDFSMPEFANRLEAETAAQLMTAAGAFLMLVKKQVPFKRKELLETMKLASSQFKPAMTSNFDTTKKKLLKEGVFNEPNKGEFTVKAPTLATLKAKLGG